MRLKFYAREGLVREPDCRPAIGQAARYLGREFVPSVIVGKQVVENAKHPATKDGFECDADSDVARVAVKNAKKGAFWPADKATAEHCGIEFADLEFADGVWDVKQSKFSGSKLSSKAAE